MIALKELNDFQCQTLMKRFPPFELSYETISHKKVFPCDYDILLAIPNAKKCCAWFTYDLTGEEDVCYLLHYNKNKAIIKIHAVPHASFPVTFAFGTVLYGSICDNVFVIEDIYHYKGISLKNVTMGEKFGCIQQFLEEWLCFSKIRSCGLHFVLPYMGRLADFKDVDAAFSIKKWTAYDIHHFQLRKWNEIAPYINIHGQANTFSNLVSHAPSPPSLSGIPSTHAFPINPHKPQYRQLTVFCVTADLQYVIYPLPACGARNQLVYYNVAYIPNIKTSVFMNKLFRKIRENQNLDAIEESDDEEDFENMALDKYVDLNKSCLMECEFHPKFKKWVPIRVVDSNSRIVHIHKL